MCFPVPSSVPSSVLIDANIILHAAFVLDSAARAALSHLRRLGCSTAIDAISLEEARARIEKLREANGLTIQAVALDSLILAFGIPVVPVTPEATAHSQHDGHLWAAMDQHRPSWMISDDVASASALRASGHAAFGSLEVAETLGGYREIEREETTSFVENERLWHMQSNKLRGSTIRFTLSLSGEPLDTQLKSVVHDHAGAIQAFYDPGRRQIVASLRGERRPLRHSCPPTHSVNMKVWPSLRRSTGRPLDKVTFALESDKRRIESRLIQPLNIQIPDNTPIARPTAEALAIDSAYVPWDG